MHAERLGHWIGTGIACVAAFLVGVLIGAIDWDRLPPRATT